MSEGTQTMSTESEGRYRASRRVTLIGALGNGVLGVGKIVVGWIANSQALIADGVHSLSDLFSDGLVLVGAREGSRAADSDHPYGHGRIETVVTTILGILLIAVAAGLAWDAARGLLGEPKTLTTPGVLALWAALVSIAIKELLYHMTLRVGRRVRSQMLQANAWHHRSDAVSSLVVVIGIGGALLGFPALDSVAAIVVAGMVALVGWRLGSGAMRELIDTGLEGERLALIRQTIEEVDGVRDLHMLRTRHMGPDALVDVHVIVDPRISISEGHFIGDQVSKRLIARVDEVSDVLVHIDPEDDQVRAPSHELPTRAQLVPELFALWSHCPGADGIEQADVVLHYLDGAIEVELSLPLSLASAEAPDAIAAAYRAAVADHAAVRHIVVQFRPE